MSVDSNKKIGIIATNKVKFREDLYPRFSPNQDYIKKYAMAIEKLPPIRIDQHGILIDGFHTLKAHELVGKTKIKVEIIRVKSEKELKQLAYKFNSVHGFQLSTDEKKQYSNEMIGEMTSKELSEILSVSERIINKWTEGKRKTLIEFRNNQILAEYLRAWNTQDSVAQMFDLEQRTISNVLENFRNFGKDSKTSEIIEHMFFYNIWNTQKGNETEIFGSFPKIFMDRLLYYHTDIFDVIYDPFCGDGTTIDSCKEMMRRYYCSDMNMVPGRERDMKKRKIQDGYPTDLQKPNLVFFDPPYWKQSKGKYSDSEDDLGNMSLEDFYRIICEFLNVLIKRKINKIAIVISPTQYANNFIFEDHIFKFNRMLDKNYEIEMRYILPYSTQQYSAPMVIKTKEEKKCLNLIRDLVIWRLENE